MKDVRLEFNNVLQSDPDGVYYVYTDADGVGLDREPIVCQRSHKVVKGSTFNTSGMTFWTDEDEIFVAAIGLFTATWTGGTHHLDDRGITVIQLIAKQEQTYYNPLPDINTQYLDVAIVIDISVSMNKTTGGIHCFEHLTMKEILGRDWTC